MKKHIIVILFFIFLWNSIAVSDDKKIADVEEKEIVELLDMLEDYEFLVNMKLYENIDKNENSKTNIESPSGDRGEKVKQ